VNVAPKYDRPLTEAEASSLTPQERAQIVNRALAVFQEIGRIMSAASSAEKSAIRCEDAATRCEQAAQRGVETARACELLLERLVPSAPSSRPSRPSRLPSMLELHDEDDTGVKIMKSNVVALLKERDDARAVAEADARRMKALAFLFGFVAAFAAACGIVWLVFKFAVANAR